LKAALEGFGTYKTVICSSELGTYESVMYAAIKVCDTDPKVEPLSNSANIRQSRPDSALVWHI
jgi:hypothetical protein